MFPPGPAALSPMSAVVEMFRNNLIVKPEDCLVGWFSHQIISLELPVGNLKGGQHSQGLKRGKKLTSSAGHFGQREKTERGI